MNPRRTLRRLAGLLPLLVTLPGGATQEPGEFHPFQQSPEPTDTNAPAWNKTASNGTPINASGPIAPAATQPAGALSGRIVFTSAGHGWTWGTSSWYTQRGVGYEMLEDYGNLDQMAIFVGYCFNAGATVVPLRPIGFQTNEVVLDNDDPGVSFAGGWASSSSTVFFGSAGDVAYRYANVAASETAVATYMPAIPAAGFYPVYTWALHGANRINQLYRVNHTGGQALVRVPHHMVGNGWVYLGTYFFNAGANAATGAVLVSNLADGNNTTGVVIADAIRFGNGMGDVDRGGGVSTYPREDECSRYWVQRALGQGQDPAIYDSASLDDGSDTVGTPARMAAEMNRETTGNRFKRVYVGFHSNAGGGRGVIGLYNNESLFPGTSTSTNQVTLARLLAKEINDDLVGMNALLETNWYDRGSNLTYARSDYAFGEIRGDSINYEMDATIVEVAFHDSDADAKLLRDVKVRNWVARGAGQGLLRYFNQFDAAPLVFLPEPPGNVRATATNGGILVAWSAPVAQSGSGAASGYVVYRSADGYGFGNPSAAGGGATSLLLTNLAVDTDLYFRVAATNAGGESLPSETVGCRRSSNLAQSRILIVNGFTRFDRTLNLRQTPTVEGYRPPGWNANAGSMERVLPRSVNAFDYAVPHGKVISALGMPFDSCQRAAITNAQLRLTNYQILVWASGNQSTSGRTFTSTEQSLVTAFLAAGGNLFVSGSEIAWDLDRASGPTAADRSFFNNQLHARLGGNTNDDSGIYSVTPAAGSIFAGSGNGLFDDGSKGIYWVGYPDVLTANGAGARAAMNYAGLGYGAAAVVYDGSAGGGKVVYLGFPFETISSAVVRRAYLGDALRLLSKPARFEIISVTGGGTVLLTLSGEPGLTYAIQRALVHGAWTSFTNVSAGSGVTTVTDLAATNGARFYRAVLTP